MAPATQYLLGMLLALACVFHISSYGSRKDNIWLAGTLRAFESFFVVIIAMLCTHDRVATDADLMSVKLGWPLAYVSQNQSRFEPPYPYDAGWQWEVLTEYNWGTMSINLLFFFACTYGVHRAISKLLVKCLKSGR